MYPSISIRYFLGQYLFLYAFHVEKSLSSTTGYFISKSFTAFSTFFRTFSKENSGVWRPIITSPSSSYSLYHSFRYGIVRWQLIQLYVQISNNTTFLPLNSLIVMGKLFVFIKPSGVLMSGARANFLFFSLMLKNEPSFILALSSTSVFSSVLEVLFILTSFLSFFSNNFCSILVTSKNPASSRLI